ncbi:MAG: pmbA, putative domain protein [Candidatus Xenolissoclinum pacificiensis L6]|uniref:PmbA, putative domain protein n=1 Tax=Candidatus Xenolissoclinum pacificiensis L6 TaxID=1401685 RepID=W2V0L1_9RICK|nr:MAG: pmbA, putative domain protein [Candidatus Xenolissoclinum pacificiensis L6]
MNSENIAKSVVSYCNSLNLECEVLVNNSVSKSANVRNQEKESVQIEENCSIKIKINKNDRSLSISSNNLSNIKELIDSNLEVIDSLPSSDCISTTEVPIKFQDYKMNSFEPSVDWLFDFSQRTEKSALENKQITNSDGACSSYYYNCISFLNSNGISGSYKKFSYANNLAVVAGSNQDMQVGYDFCVASDHNKLIDPENFGCRIASNTVSSLNPQKIGNCNVPVLLDHSVSSSFIDYILSSINGNQVVSKTTFLKDKLNQKVFSDNVNIDSNPRDVQAVGYRPFDDEGINSHRVPLIENGVLKNWMLDRYTAKKLSLESNGHGSKGQSGITRPGIANISIKPGKLSKDEIIKSMQSGLYITSLFGFGVNLTTGDFSQGAQGFWIANGKIEYPISGITIASNLLDMFSEMKFSSDIPSQYIINSPNILFSNMSVACK